MDERALALVALASLSSLAAVACDPVGTVHGTVVEAPTKAPVSGADVTMSCGAAGEKVKTDARGRYETKQVGFLDEGCAVEAAKDGYSTARSTLAGRCTDADAEHCRHAQVDLELAPQK